jgi:hypothetical protein
MERFLCLLQYNSWFTFSDFQEPVTVRSCRPIHAKELTMVCCTELLTQCSSITFLYAPQRPHLKVENSCISFLLIFMFFFVVSKNC